MSKAKKVGMSYSCHVFLCYPQRCTSCLFSFLDTKIIVCKKLFVLSAATKKTTFIFKQLMIRVSHWSWSDIMTTDETGEERRKREGWGIIIGRRSKINGKEIKIDDWCYSQSFEFCCLKSVDSELLCLFFLTCVTQVVYIVLLAVGCFPHHHHLLFFASLSSLCLLSFHER